MRALAVRTALVLAGLLWLVAGTARAQEQVIPFEERMNLAIVQVSIDGSEPMNMVCDTGATRTMILPETARRMGLEGSPVQYGGIGGGGQAEVATCDRFRVGPVEVRDLEVMIADIPSVTQQLQMQGIDCHGLVGHSFISRFVTTFDYGADQIRVTPADGAGPDGAGGGGAAAEPAFIGARLGDDPDGVRILELVEDGPLDDARLREDDVITELDGRRVGSVADLEEILRSIEPGTTVEVIYVRRRRDRDEEITLTERPM